VTKDELTLRGSDFRFGRSDLYYHEISVTKRGSDGGRVRGMMRFVCLCENYDLSSNFGSLYISQGRRESRESIASFGIK
jgi:hypothetical protein